MAARGGAEGEGVEQTTSRAGITLFFLPSHTCILFFNKVLLKLFKMKGRDDGNIVIRPQ